VELCPLAAGEFLVEVLEEMYLEKLDQLRVIAGRRGPGIFFQE